MNLKEIEKQIKHTFSNRIKEFMLKNNLSIIEFSKNMNISLSTVKNWLAEKCLPKLKQIEKAADYFNCSIDYLIGRDF